MKRSEVIDLLTIISGVNGRTVGEADVAIWCELVGDLDFADARAAVKAHYMDSDRWIMPSHIRERVQLVRTARLARTPLPEAPDEIVDDPAGYLAWKRRTIGEIADGTYERRMLARGELRALDGGGR